MQQFKFLYPTIVKLKKDRKMC